MKIRCEIFVRGCYSTLLSCGSNYADTGSYQELVVYVFHSGVWGNIALVCVGKGETYVVPNGVRAKMWIVCGDVRM